MSLKVLVVDSSARGHALAWKLAQSPRVSKIYCAPGNPGTAEIAENISISPTAVSSLADFVEKNRIDLTVVGTEDAIDACIADEFSRRCLRIAAPLASAGKIETSKIFMKRFLHRIGVSIAPFEVVHNYREAMALVAQHGYPIVAKADGIARGKGVYVCRRWREADDAFYGFFIEKKMSTATRFGVVIEDFLSGEEVSAHAFCSGRDTLHLPLSCDYKPRYEDNRGLNTGGMGGYSPVDWVSVAVEERMKREIIDAVARAMHEEHIPFVGVMYPGIILTPDPVVLEINARPGDPEFQILLRRLVSDMVNPIESCIEGTLRVCVMEWSPSYAVAVTLVSGGYPTEATPPIARIYGLEDARRIPGVEIFHAGTTLIDGVLYAAGGRVLSLTTLGTTLEEARGLAYEAVGCITYEGMGYRTDIGCRMRME